ncbi:MAG: response regulator transcription factor [Opitutaceae bacterium]|nr:response regulator transcription factor [Opitutaceae bacterium]
MVVLVVDDEKKVAGLVRSGLEEQGWTVEVAHDGNDALTLAGSRHFDALVLDIMLPGRDGLSVLRRLREEKNTVPVVLLTARGDVRERVEGLELGADDYLPKPFSMLELVARLKAVWRRRTGDGLNVLSYADLVVNLHTRAVRRGDRAIELTAREFSLLECLLRTPGRVVTRTQLYESVWGYNFDPETNIVDVAIQRLRRKIDDDSGPRLIQTVRGVGYALQTEGR